MAKLKPITRNCFTCDRITLKFYYKVFGYNYQTARPARYYASGNTVWGCFRDAERVVHSNKTNINMQIREETVLPVDPVIF